MAFLGLPLRKFLCWDLRTATLALAIYIIIAGVFGTLMHLLDVIAQFDPNFEISGGFASAWRRHVWEGWTACNVVMIVSHIVMVVMSSFLIVAIKRIPVYHEYTISKVYFALLICYVIIELGVALYQYSWYGPNTFRLPYLVFSFLFWLIRFMLNCLGITVAFSRLSELDYELTYGEKKSMAASRYQSRSDLLNAPPPAQRHPYGRHRDDSHV